MGCALPIDFSGTLGPVKTTIQATQLAWLFIEEIVRLHHGLPGTIQLSLIVMLNSRGSLERNTSTSRSETPDVNCIPSPKGRSVKTLDKNEHKCAPKAAPGVQGFVCKA